MTSLTERAERHERTDGQTDGRLTVAIPRGKNDGRKHFAQRYSLYLPTIIICASSVLYLRFNLCMLCNKIYIFLQICFVRYVHGWYSLKRLSEMHNVILFIVGHLQSVISEFCIFRSCKFYLVTVGPTFSTALFILLLHFPFLHFAVW